MGTGEPTYVAQDVMEVVSLTHVRDEGWTRPTLNPPL